MLRSKVEELLLSSTECNKRKENFALRRCKEKLSLVKRSLVQYKEHAVGYIHEKHLNTAGNV